MYKKNMLERKRKIKRYLNHREYIISKQTTLPPQKNGTIWGYPCYTYRFFIHGSGGGVEENP